VCSVKQGSSLVQVFVHPLWLVADLVARILGSKEEKYRSSLLSSMVAFVLVTVFSWFLQKVLVYNCTLAFTLWIYCIKNLDFIWTSILCGCLLLWTTFHRNLIPVCFSIIFCHCEELSQDWARQINEIDSITFQLCLQSHICEEEIVSEVSEQALENYLYLVAD
jgi:hypothetical protein